MSGLLFRRLNIPEYEFVPLDERHPVNAAFSTLNFVEDKGGIKLELACNGLLLCGTFRMLDGKCNYYIYNPTTKDFTTLPDPVDRVFRFTRGIQSVYAVNLAFDPRKSSHYRVICIYFSERLREHFEIEIYSSETGLWRRRSDPFYADSVDVNFKLGIYWDGAINWISYWGDGIYFNLDEERLGTLPMPPVPDGWEEGRRIRYFGESLDHLHLIEIYGPRTTQFNVYEMDREYSGWFIKYRVDLKAVMNAFPEAICDYLDPSDLHHYRFLTPCVIRRENEEESFLVLSIPGKLIRYNLADKTFKKLYDFAPDVSVGDSFPPMFGWFDCFQYFECFI